MLRRLILALPGAALLQLAGLTPITAVAQSAGRVGTDDWAAGRSGSGAETGSRPAVSGAVRSSSDPKTAAGLTSALPVAPPLHPAAAFQPSGPRIARGALVWLHGSGEIGAPPPDAPDWVALMAQRGLDIWRFDRERGQDPLDPGIAALARGVAGLRAGGYRHIIVAGHSRGAWIALGILAHPGLADGVVAIDPAAHGFRPERKTMALAAWDTLWRDAKPGKTRVVLVQLRDDPFDFDPQRRRAVAEAASRRDGYRLLSIFLPPAPTGHMGVFDPDFDRLFGARIAASVDPLPEEVAARPSVGRR